MIFNGVDPTSLHRGISIAKEIPPGMPTHSVETLQGRRGERVAGTMMEQAEYIVRINIAGRNNADAWQARALLAQWACSSRETTSELIPTHWPSVAYDAIIKEIEPIEPVHGFATIEAVFLIPRPFAHEVIWRTASGSGGTTLYIGGSSTARPIIRHTMSSGAQEYSLMLDNETCMRVITQLNRGDVLEMDVSTGGIGILTINGVHAEENIDFTATRWRPGFEPGKHTMTASDAGELVIKWRNEWK